jgi:integrase
LNVTDALTPHTESKKPKLLDQIRDAVRIRHYSIRTEEAYVQWIRRFILFHQKRSKKLPAVLTRDEVRTLFSHLQGDKWIMANLLYGAGLRLMECLRLRVKDIDFSYRQLIVRGGKGEKDRITMLPARVIKPLKDHLIDVEGLHQRDLREGFGRVYLPHALDRKYPNANREWIWQYVFPSIKRSVDPRTGVEQRHHLDETVLQRAIREAARKASFPKRVGPQSRMI